MRKGDMAAQRQDTPSPPKSDSPPVHQALIPAPATPALVPRKDVQELVNTSDPLNRRPQPSIPFFTEEGAAGQGGPLGSCLGLLPDLAQIAEAAGCGWEGCKPLTEDGVNRLLDAILRLIVTDKQPLTFVANLATDFERLKFLSEQVAATCPASTSYYRDAEAAAPLPYSCHRLLTWLLERGYAISNIADCAAAGPDGYFGCELFRVSELSGTDRDEILAEMDEFHRQQLELLDVGAASNQAITVVISIGPSKNCGK